MHFSYSPCEYEKRSERVIAEGGKYANFHSLTPSLGCKHFLAISLISS